MATRDIKTRFKLEGEQAFKKAMSDAANSIKVLNSEQRLAAAEFEATGDAQQYAAEQARILKEKIEQQKKAVEAAEDAVRELTKNGVEPNSKQLQTWKTKLNDAKSALKKMESQLDSTEAELKDQNSVLGKAKTAMANAETKVKSLNSEEALAEAQFKATGDKEQYAADKTRILKEKIEAQKQAVEIAETAIKSMTENGGDPASEERQEWKGKLVNAKTQLAKLETQLNETESEIKDQNSALGKAKTAMANAETKVKALNSEEALAEAQFKATGDKEQYLADKTRITKLKIEEQKKAVAAAEEAIKSMTDNGVDPASDEMIEWKTKLNEAKTKLANMETQLDKTEAELKEQNSTLGKAKTAMTNAETKVKSLTKEEELAAAQFKATGDKEQYLADKTRILKEKIEAQKTAVKAAEDAIKSLTDNGVDPNSEEVQKWRDKLVTAKLGLVNLENRLDHVGDEVDEETEAFGEATGGAGDLKEAIDKVGEGVDYQNVISAIDSITGHMEAVVKAAARAAKAVWEMGVDAGKWADDLATAANEAGVDVETYQSWTYASRFIDTSVSDIVKSWQDIQKHMKEGNTEYLASLASMGIASRTASNQVRSSEDIFWDAIDYLHGISDEALRAEKATELFGNDWRKLNPLINAGSRAYKDMAEEGMRVAVVSEENVQALGEVDDAVQDFTAQFDKLKYDALAALAPTFKTVAEAMSAAVQSMNEFVQSEEGQAALADLNESVSGLIKSFLGEDNGKGTFEGIVTGAKDALKKLNDALDWLSKHGDVVKGIVEGLGVAWAGMKVTKGVLEFMTLLKAIPLAKLTTIFGNGAGAAAGQAASNTVSSAAAGAAGKVASAAGGTSALADAAIGLGVPAAVITAAVLPALLADNLNRAQIKERLETIKAEALAAAEGMGTEAQAALEVINQAADALGESETKLNVLGQKVVGDVEAIEAAMRQAEELNNSEDGGFLSNKTSLLLHHNNENGMAAGREAELLDTVMTETLDALTNPKTQQTAEDIGSAISDAMDEIIEARDALDESVSAENIESMYGLIDKLIESQGVFESLSEETKALLGQYFDEDSGFGAGSATQFDDAQQVLDAIYADLDSAWNKYIEGGKAMPEGFAQGANENAGKAAEAGSNMAQGAIDAAEATLDSHSPSRVFETIGGNAAVGMANGIYARGDEAIRAAQWLAQSVTNIMQDALKIHSPSRVFERLGEFTGLGYAEGIESSADRVNRAVDAMIGATSRRPIIAIGGSPVADAASTMSVGAAGTKGAKPDTVHVTMVLDEEVLGDVMAPIVNDKIGAKMNATRR